MLLYAHRAAFPEHARALRWLTAMATGRTPWCVPVFCIGEFVRVATHRAVLSPPSTLDQAFGALEGLLASPSVRVISPGPEFPRLYEEAVRAGDARGNLAFDAQIAAVCREHGVTGLLTADRDFARFPWPRPVSLVEEPPG